MMWVTIEGLAPSMDGPLGGYTIMWALTSSVGFWEVVGTTERGVALEEVGR